MLSTQRPNKVLLNQQKARHIRDMRSIKGYEDKKPKTAEKLRKIADHNAYLLIQGRESEIKHPELKGLDEVYYSVSYRLSCQEWAEE